MGFSSLSSGVVLTGDRPSGSLHLGHYAGSLSTRLKLQETHTQYVLIADTQVLTDHWEQAGQLRTYIYELIKDYLAIGLDPQKTTFTVQSCLPALAELTVYYMNLVHIGRLERNPTVKAEIQQKKDQSLPVGFLCYPISQAADITGFQGTLVPVGEDQVPMIEQANEIVQKFNRIYQTDCLKKAEPLLSVQGRLPGIDGQAKASKSLGNAIFLKDDPKVIREKVFNMFTDPDHIHVTDPGKVEGNVVFTYLDAFHPCPEEVESLKQAYRKGGLGDVTLKRELNETLQSFLKPIREKRESLDPSYLTEVLVQGIEKTKKITQGTLDQVKQAMRLDHF